MRTNVASNTGVRVFIPSSARFGVPFKNLVVVETAFLEVHSAADARDSGADYDGIVVFVGDWGV